METKAKEMKTILLTGFGPHDTAQYNGGIYRNGSAVTMEAAHADAYIKAKLAREVPSKDHPDVQALQDLENKNAETREAIRMEMNGYEQPPKNSGNN